MRIACIGVVAISLVISPAFAQTSWPNQREGDFVLKDYRFASGEILPELRLHYTTLGTARRDAGGGIVNGVLLLHGTGGTGKHWPQKEEDDWIGGFEQRAREAMLHELLLGRLDASQTCLGEGHGNGDGSW